MLIGISETAESGSCSRQTNHVRYLAARVLQEQDLEATAATVQAATWELPLHSECDEVGRDCIDYVCAWFLRWNDQSRTRDSHSNTLP